MTVGLIVCAAALLTAGALGLAWRARDGQLRVPAGAARPGGARPGPEPAALLSADDLGGPLGRRATLVQFSTEFCSRCPATRRLLADVAGAADGIAVVEIDAESRLDLVRRLDIRRTPTVLVLNPQGRVTRRASGQPRKAEVIAAVRAAVP